MPHSVVGPMARTVDDAAIMLDIISRPDSRDPYMWPVPFSMPGDDLWRDISDLRVAFSPRLGCNSPLTDTESDGLVAQAATLLADAGAQVAHEDPVWPVDPLVPFRVFWETACLSCMEATVAERRELLDPLIRSVGTSGAKNSILDYLLAMEQRMAIAAAAKLFFERHDLLVGPVMPVPAYDAGRDVPEGFDSEDWAWCPYTYLCNMTGQPSASVPIGFTAAGLPVGVQIIGRMGGETDVLRAASAIETAVPFHLRRPPCLG